MNNNSTQYRYYKYRIKLEKLKHCTGVLVVISRILLILAIVAYRW